MLALTRWAMWSVGLLVWDYIYLFIQYCTIISLLLSTNMDNDKTKLFLNLFSLSFSQMKKNLFHLIHSKTYHKADKNLKNAPHLVFNVIKKHLLILWHCSTHLILLNTLIGCTMFGEKRDFWQWPTCVIKHNKC